MEALESQVQGILQELYDKIIDHPGVGICLKQGSCNFENWVQVELCSILQKRFCSEYDIELEKEKNANADIFIKPKNGGAPISIEIKVARIGGQQDGACAPRNADHAVKVDRIVKDISKLKSIEGVRLLLCVVYRGKGKVYKGWGQLTPELRSTPETDYREQIFKEIRNTKFVSYPANIDKGVLLDCFIF